MTLHGDIEHLLLTRFNVGLDARGGPGEQWLRDRVGIFERFTVPSIRRQRRLPAKWLIYCDDGHGSPDWFRDWARGLEGLPIDWVWVSDLSPETWTRTVEQRIHTSARLLLTTRIDNDDAVGPDFCARIQREVVRPGEFLNPTFGLQWDGRYFYFRADPSSPFISYVEMSNSDSVRTVFAGQHDRAAEIAPVRQIRARPMWLQVLHGGNMANEVAGVAVPLRFARCSDFPMVDEANTPSLSETMRTAWRLARKVAAAPHRVRRLVDIARPEHGGSA